jgi:hypothetical protein
MKKKMKHILPVVLTIAIIGCKEVYDPELTVTKKLLVVEGIITQEPVSHTIRLSRAVRFDTTSIQPETGATVFVTDNSGIRYNFAETSSGKYASDPAQFRPEILKTYILTVETADKRIYTSSPQTLLPKEDFDTVSYVVKSEMYPSTVGGGFRMLAVKGIELFTPLVAGTENPYYRFSNTVLIQYTMYQPIGTGYLYYSWKKYYPNEFFNLNYHEDTNLQIGSHDLGFYPMDTVFHSIFSTLDYLILGDIKSFFWVTRTLNSYLVSFKQYHLNADIYQYYNLINKQLTAKQRILDPVSFQIRGNITCISNPEEPVLGLFEASSSAVLTYSLQPLIFGDQVTFKKIKPLDMDTIPETGKSFFSYPNFWTN